MQITLRPLVAVIMGSQSDWPVMKKASKVLVGLGIAHTDNIVSAHRTPDRMVTFAKQAKTNGFLCIIAGAGGSAHLPGMVASLTPLPVIGVPVPSKTNPINDYAAKYSMDCMPPGVPLAVMPIGGAENAALYAARILALSDSELAQRLDSYIAAMAAKVQNEPVDEEPPKP